MPKGEHFKKPNPRINQVSFKVSDKELEALRALASAQGLSVPEWIRTKIGVKHDNTVVEKKVEVVKEVEQKIEEIKEEKIIETSKEVETPPEAKKVVVQVPTPPIGNDDDDDVIKNQMSLF